MSFTAASDSVDKDEELGASIWKSSRAGRAAKSVGKAKAKETSPPPTMPIAPRTSLQSKEARRANEALGQKEPAPQTSQLRQSTGKLHATKGSEGAETCYALID